MNSLRSKIGGRSLYLLSQIAGKSCRFQLRGLEHLKQAQATGRPIIFAAWHGMTMMLVGFFASHYDFSKMVLLMPDDWRGGTLFQFSSLLGAQPYPMDLSGDSSMATARKLAQLVRRVKKGDDCYITPDGPDGPSYVIKPGVAYIAQKAKAIILPIGAYARNSYRLNRWDMYTIPYPFSRISINVGAPVASPGGENSLEALTEHLTDRLHRVTAQAAADYYERHA